MAIKAKQEVIALAFLQTHDVHGVEAVDESEGEIEPRLMCLRHRIQRVFAPRVLLVTRPRVLESVYDCFLTIVCGT